MATMVANAQVNLPLTGNGGKASPIFSSFSPLSVDFSAAWGTGVNLTSNIPEGFSNETYPKCRIELDEIETTGGNMGLNVKYTDGTSDAALSISSNNGTFEFDLPHPNIKNILFRSRNGVQHAVIKRFALVDAEGHEVETVMSVVDNATTTTPANTYNVTFGWNWAELGGANWVVSFSEGQKAVYAFTFKEGISAGGVFQIKESIGGTDNFLGFDEGKTEIKYTVTSPDYSAICIQCKDKTKSFLLTSATVTVVQPVQVNATGISSFVTDSPLDFTGQNVNVYVVEDNSALAGDVLTLKKVDKVEAGAYFIKGTANAKADIPVYAGEVEEQANILKGSTTAVGTSTQGYTRYALSNVDGLLHPVSNDVEIPAGKAYLELPSSAEAKTIKLVFDGEVTGVTNIATENAADARCFNLQGQRVNANTKGIVIKNGRKYINK